MRVAGKEHGEPLSQPRTRPSIFEGQGSGRCHPSRRDGIKDVLPRQLIIRYLHMRARNLYPSRCPPLPRLLALPSKCIFRKSRADGEHYNSLAKACEGCGCAQLECYTGRACALMPENRADAARSPPPNHAILRFLLEEPLKRGRAGQDRGGTGCCCIKFLFWGRGFIQKIGIVFTHSEGFYLEAKTQGRHTKGTNRHRQEDLRALGDF